jgi:hypothetical protein
MKKRLAALVVFGLTLMTGVLSTAAFDFLRKQSWKEPWKAAGGNSSAPPISFPAPGNFDKSFDRSLP